VTVIARTIRATPHRATNATWDVIVALLAPQGGEAKTELMKVAGVASSLVASEAPKQDDKIVVWGGGPRVRINCTYGDDAITGDNSNEEKLPKSPTNGDWRMSLPCPEEDLQWVTDALAKKSKRITAHKLGEKPDTDAEGEDTTEASINTEAFFRP
jgi:hypothetical protein